MKNNLIKGAMFGIAAVLISTVGSKWVPQLGEV